MNREKIAAAVCEKILPGYARSQRQQRYLNKLCKVRSLKDEVKESALVELMGNKAQMDYDNKRFIVTLEKEPYVLIVYDLATENLSER